MANNKEGGEGKFSYSKIKTEDDLLSSKTYTIKEQVERGRQGVPADGQGYADMERNKIGRDDINKSGSFSQGINAENFKKTDDKPNIIGDKTTEKNNMPAIHNLSEKSGGLKTAETSKGKDTDKDKEQGTGSQSLGKKNMPDVHYLSDKKEQPSSGTKIKDQSNDIEHN